MAEIMLRGDVGSGNNEKGLAGARDFFVGADGLEPPTPCL